MLHREIYLPRLSLHRSRKSPPPPELNWGGLLLPAYEMNEIVHERGQRGKVFFIVVRNMNISSVLPVLMEINKNINFLKKI